MADVDEEVWLFDRRDELLGYLAREGLEHGAIAPEPYWYVAPYVSVWGIGSLKTPGRVGWWAVCGDHPTDYVSSDGLHGPREVLRAIGERWLEVSSFMLEGRAHPTVTIGRPEDWPSLGGLLNSRAKTFLEWANDDSIWTDAS
jgi:hypothetical protein